jgi:hypothetical protein
VNCSDLKCRRGTSLHEEQTFVGTHRTSDSCQVLTSGQLLVEKDRDGELSGRPETDYVAHGGELVGGAYEDPDRLTHVAKRRAVRKRSPTAAPPS